MVALRSNWINLKPKDGRHEVIHEFLDKLEHILCFIELFRKFSILPKVKFDMTDIRNQKLLMFLGSTVCQEAF